MAYDVHEDICIRSQLRICAYEETNTQNRRCETEKRAKHYADRTASRARAGGGAKAYAQKVCTFFDM